MSNELVGCGGPAPPFLGLRWGSLNMLRSCGGSSGLSVLSSGRPDFFSSNELDGVRSANKIFWGLVSSSSSSEPPEPPLDGLDGLDRSPSEPGRPRKTEAAEPRRESAEGGGADGPPVGFSLARGTWIGVAVPITVLVDFMP
jgi:hypothetical protein